MEHTIQALEGNNSEQSEQIQYYQGGTHHHNSLLMLQKSPQEASVAIFPQTADRSYKGPMPLTSAKKSTVQVLPAHGGAATTTCKKQ